MYYLCLICGKILHGWGLPPHFSYKHHEIFEVMRRVQREKHGMFYKYNDYYTLEGQLVAVCVGDSKDYYSKRNVEMWIKILKERGSKVSQRLKKEMEQLGLDVQ